MDWILTSVKRSSLLRLAVAALLLLPVVWMSHGAAPISPQAKEIHNRALVFDAHIHSVEREFYHGGSIGDRQSNGQFDLPRAREGGLGAMFFSVYVAEDYYPARLETKQALRLIDCALTQLHNNYQQIELALNATDVERIHRSGKIAAVLDLEGSFDLDGDLAVLRMLYRLGLRSLQLSAHNRPNHYADTCCSPPQWHGITAHGADFVLVILPRLHIRIVERGVIRRRMKIPIDRIPVTPPDLETALVIASELNVICPPGKPLCSERRGGRD